MITSFSRNGLASSVLLFGALAAGCTAPDNVSAPILTAAVAPPSQFQSYDGGVITLVSEENGTQYTLDVSAQQIRFSDGRTLLLDFEQTTEVLATFHGTLVADPVAEALNHLPTTTCEPPQVRCDAPQVASTSNASSPFVWRFVDGSKDKTKKGKKNTPDDNGFETASYYNPCNDVATAAISASGRFRDQRTSIWDKAWAYGIGEAGNYLFKRLPRGAPSAILFGAEVAGSLVDHLNARVEVSVLAFTWNSYNCANRQVTTGPIITNSNGGGGGGRQLVCTSVLVEISFDGGQTWHRVDATVCEYR